METTERKVWTRDEINALLISSDIAVEKAILRIYDRQTRDEQNTQSTRHQNSIGFSGAAASTGSYCAQWLLAGRNYGGTKVAERHLSGVWLAKARKICLIHSKQLVEIANNG